MASDILQAMKTATESLGPEVHRKATYNSVWLNALPKGSFPLGRGLTQTSFTIENSLPTNDELAWEKIVNSSTSGTAANMGADGGLCDRSWNDVEWGFSEQNYSPERISIRGPVVCKDMKYHHNVSQFLNAYVAEIGKHSKRILENKLQNEYMGKGRQVTLSGTTSSAAALNDEAVTNKAISDSSNTLNDTVELLPAHLDQLAIKLIESGATEGDSGGFVELGPNGPVFPLIIGMEAAHNLLKADDNIRADYRHASGSELLKRIGADKVVGNWRLIVVTNPPRFKRNSGGTGYDRISERVALSSSELTAGSGTKINPNYTGKDISDGDGVYEAAIALVPSVMKQLVVPASVPNNLGFSPDSYSGDWKFVTGAYKFDSGSADELDSKGRHFGTYEMAFEPIFGDHGATVLFKRDNVVA